MTTLVKAIIVLVLILLIVAVPVGVGVYENIHGRSLQKAADAVVISQLSKQNAQALAKAQHAAQDAEAKIQAQAQASIAAAEASRNVASHQLHIALSKLKSYESTPADKVWLNTPVPADIARLFNNPGSQ